ncbi:S8 family serine peptidase [Paenibacillus donghaensis]|uniref:Peptidase S8/S53 domain-containing protein n=1 Tax=Paenibacillus donghaensis TaxID=414771 RepID=A0A2Z2KHH7_9BACL|nr:S8 family serine peptidase [Paenibacillus donghaensis]ASA25347.1 hypothetical protein B9T62_34215 [Paenibacillus donghaensis]
MKILSVAIIDDGISGDIFDNKLAHNIEINKFCEIILCKKENQVVNTHGTICAAILCKYTNSVCISSVKILENGRGDVEQLCTSLEWCEDNDIDVINISLGSCNFLDYYKLRNIINRLARKNILIVCSAHNNNLLTYPASFSNVIGVKCDSNGLLKEGECIENHDLCAGVDLIAFAKHEIKGFKIQKNFNSFATPLVTARASDILYQRRNLSVEEIKNKLRYQSHQLKHPHLNSYRIPDWINKAFIFVVDSLSVYSTFFYFDVIGELYINHEALVSYVENVLISDISQEIDTLIIFSKLQIEINLFNSINQLCGKHNTNVVYIDILGNKESKSIVEKNIKVWDKSVIYRIIDMEVINKENISVPQVLISFSNNYEMYEILCLMKNFFSQSMYNAFVACDQAVAFLYDLEYVPVNMKKIKETVSYLGKMIVEKNSDIFIFGLIAEKEFILNKLRTQLNTDVFIKVEKYYDSRVKISVNKNKTKDRIFLIDSITAENVYGIFEFLVETLK